jgi:P-type Cu2+ transporter
MSDKSNGISHQHNHEHRDDDANSTEPTVQTTSPTGVHDHGHHTHHQEPVPPPDVTDVPEEAHDHSGGVLTESMIAGAAQADAHAAHKGRGEPSATTLGVHAGHEVAHEGHGGHAAAAGDEHAGHDAHAGHIDHTGHEFMFRNRFWVCLLLTVPVLFYSHMLQMWFGFSAPAFPGSNWIAPLFAFIIFIYGGVPFLQMAVPELRARKPGMMTLISLAITVAFIYSVAALWIDPAGGFFWEMALLIDVMLLGHWLEMRSVRQASGALNELAKLMPDTAERICLDGSTETVPTSELRVGDLLLVRPGASVPADGEVVEGESHVNEAMITGESKPVDKAPQSRVIAGTVNGDGSLRVRVSAIGEETALAGIMRLVEQAQNSKSRTQVLADKAAGWLFYVALAAAIITAIAWSIATGFNVEVVQRVATVLVIACPHALGLAVPLVVAISTSLAAQNGILVRDRLALEEARNIDTIIFDKTGTLTEGEQGVVGIATVKGWSEEQALALAAAVEGDSEHIIAQAIRRAASEHNLPLPAVTEFSAIKGRGARATVENHTVHIGGPRLLEMLELTPPATLADFIKQAEAKGQSVIHLVQGQEIVASFALADVIRPESAAAIQQLQEQGIEVVMLTGDSNAVAKAVAEELGINQYFAEVLPEHKDEQVAKLQAQGRKVAMVGDGVNDAPALTRADIGIAVGSGTDVAVESADIILVQSNPLDVAKIFTLSSATHRKMIQNLWWATGYNIVAIPLAAGIFANWGINLSPAVGALLMSVSTIVVAINAQLLRRLPLGKTA